jgi:ubiquinone/menaquinone biosynthesis C-methylase UbiE
VQPLTYEYEKDTRQAYRNVQKAHTYKGYQSRELTWGRLTSWREWTIIQGVLTRCSLPVQAKILDIPCGSGIMGRIFRLFPHPVVAADISLEMMGLAREDYNFAHFLGFVQADITRTPFDPGDFACIVIMGLMHRLPAAIRRKVLSEVAALKPRYAIISYSLDSPWQRLKQRLLKRLKAGYSSAPVPASYGDIVRELQAEGFQVRRFCHTIPLLSAEIVLALERPD